MPMVKFLLSATAHSHHRHPAVYRERMTDDVARPGTAEPQHGRGDLLGPTRAADRNVLRYLGVRLLIPTDDIAGDLRVPVFACAIRRRGNAGHDAGIVERGVEPAELGNGAVYHSRHLGVVTHVAAHGDCLV